MEPTAVVLDAGDGRRLRVPNRLLQDSVVTVHEQPPPAPEGAGEEP